MQQLRGTEQQQMSSQMPLRKSLRRKSICLNRFLIHMQVPYSGKKKPTKDTNKEEKQVPVFKAGGDVLTLLALIYKAANSQDLKGNDEFQVPLL